MKLYSPEGEGPINVSKEQSQIMFDAGWTKTPSKKKEVNNSEDDAETSAEVKNATSARKKPTSLSKAKRISKTEE